VKIERAIYKPEVIEQWAARRRANERTWRWKWAFIAPLWVGGVALWSIDFGPWYVLLGVAIYITTIVNGMQRYALKCPHCEKHVLDFHAGEGGVSPFIPEDYWCPHCLHWLVAPHFSQPDTPKQ
jgi:hypothetical protein